MRCHSFSETSPAVFRRTSWNGSSSLLPQHTKTFSQHSASLESFLKAKWQMMRRPKRSTIRTDVYEIRPRADNHGVDLVGDALPYSPIWYRGPKAITDAIDYAKFRSPSRRAVIRVYDEAGNVIETHEHSGEFKEAL
jgi:hypothetical protein